ncbi:MAG: hypothetical protein IJ371_05795 [Clostridia bacterium]|nr:hypothetical protein [Clostridia bacterium]
MEFIPNSNSDYKELLDKTKEEKRADIHSFHRYYGKLIPAIPRAFIREFTKEGDTVADFFSGSGTVAVESKILNRNFIGYEINPLSHFISTVKTTEFDTDILNQINAEIEEKLYDQEYINSIENLGDLPYCINIDHWFKKNVQEDMRLIKYVVDEVTTKNKLKLSKDKQEKYKSFYYAIISSIIKQVSNCDPAHVFPGFSKRMRKLEEEGKNEKDAKKTFINALKRKTKDFDVYKYSNSSVKIINGDSVNAKIDKYKDSVSLFVTNPPYISSVRYIETVKLELYWLEYIKNTTEYNTLAKDMVGNDHIAMKEVNNVLKTKYDEINQTVEKIREVDSKNAFVVAKYFNDMEKVIKNMFTMLKKGGKVVVKISDSKVRKINVETGKFLTLIAEKVGFTLKDVFLDKIENRTLTTARNSYSDIIVNDYIIIWEK